MLYCKTVFGYTESVSDILPFRGLAANNERHEHARDECSVLWRDFRPSDGALGMHSDSVHVCNNILDTWSGMSDSRRSYLDSRDRAITRRRLAWRCPAQDHCSQYSSISHSEVLIVPMLMM